MPLESEKLIMIISYIKGAVAPWGNFIEFQFEKKNDNLFNDFQIINLKYLHFQLSILIYLI